MRTGLSHEILRAVPPALLSILLLSGAALALTFHEVEKNLDTNKNTKVAVKDYWSTVKGREVSWTGTVFDVKGGRSSYKIQAKVGGSHRPNVTIVTEDPRAVKLKKGQSISFRGTLSNFKTWSGHVTLEIDNARLQ